MIKTLQVQSEGTDIIARIMVEMEEVFSLINRPRTWDSCPQDIGSREMATAADPPSVSLT